MRFRTLTVAAMCALSVVVVGQSRGGAPQPPAVDTVAPDIPGVVTGGTKVQVLKDGLDGTEGPIAMPDGSVIFSEINTHRTIRIDKDNTFSTFLEKTGGTTGVAFDSQGRLFAAVVPWGSTSFSIIYPEAAKRVVIDNYDGKPFGRPNDLAIARNGGMYFTDSANAQPRPPEGPPLPAAFYYLPPGAPKAIQILNDVAFPNGVILSRDEKVLYLNNSGGEYLLAFDVQPDGSLTNRRNLAKYDGLKPNAAGVVASGADGLTIDSQGRVYVAAVQRCAGLHASGKAPRDDPNAQTSAECGLRRARQEDPVHRRAWSRLEGADGRRGFQRSREVRRRCHRVRFCTDPHRCLCVR